MIEIKAYKCEHCLKKVLQNKSSIKRHEIKCFHNPVNRACVTCKNFNNYERFEHTELPHCPVEHLPRSCECEKNIKFNLEHNCLSWTKKD